MESKEPSHYDNFLGWMYPNNADMMRDALPVDVLIERIESLEKPTNASRWTLLYLNGEGVRQIADAEKLGQNYGKIYMAMGALARDLAQNS